MDRKEKKNLGSTCILILTIILVAVLLAPVVYVSRYAYPWSDDFSYGAEARTTFLASGSVIKAVLAAINNTIITYFDWQGTYTSCFLMSVQPAVWRVAFYHLTGVIMLGSVLLSYISFGLVLMSKILRMPKRISLSIVLLVYLISVECVPGIAEAFTWFNSAVHYTFMHSVFIFLLSMIMNFLCDVYRNSDAVSGAVLIRRTALLCLLALVAAGGNNVTILFGALSILLVEGAIIFYYFVFSKGQNKKILLMARRSLPIVCAYFIGFFINVLAPGNGKRMNIAAAGGGQLELFKVIGRAFQVAYLDIMNRLPLDVLMVLLVCAVMIWHSYAKNGSLKAMEFSFPLPGVVLLASFCLFAAIFCPMLVLYDMDEELRYVYMNATSMARTENVVYYCLVLLLLVNLLYFLGWLYRKGLNFSSDIISVIVAVIAVVICCAANKNALETRQREYLTATAVGDLKDQTAQYYGYQMAINTQRLESADEDVLVMPIAVNPDSLYPYDASDWIEGTRGYYQKNSVTYESEPYVFSR